MLACAIAFAFCAVWFWSDKKLTANEPKIIAGIAAYCVVAWWFRISARNRKILDVAATKVVPASKK